MSLSSNAIASTILESVAETAPEAAHVAAGGSSTAQFCKVWAQAKPVLQLVAGVALIIPGLGPTVGGVLTGLIKVIDQVSADICG